MSKLICKLIWMTRRGREGWGWEGDLDGVS